MTTPEPMAATACELWQRCVGSTAHKNVHTPVTMTPRTICAIWMTVVNLSYDKHTRSAPVVVPIHDGMNKAVDDGEVVPRRKLDDASKPRVSENSAMVIPMEE